MSSTEALLQQLISNVQGLTFEVSRQGQELSRVRELLAASPDFVLVDDAGRSSGHTPFPENLGTLSPSLSIPCGPSPRARSILYP